MKNKISHIAKVLFPLIVIIIIFTIFLLECENVSYDGYTFDITSMGSEIKLITTDPYNGNTIAINKDNIKIDGNSYSYFIKKNGKTYDTVFLNQSGNYISFNNITTEHVYFHNSIKNSLSTLDSSKIKFNNENTSYTTDYNENYLINSTITAYLAVIELYMKIKIYIVIFTLFTIILYLCYLKPLFVLELFDKIFKLGNCGVPDIQRLKVFSVFLILVGALMIFLLL